MVNWQLRGHGELTEPATVRPPSILEDVGPLPSAILAHLGRRLVTEGAVNSAFDDIGPRVFDGIVVVLVSSPLTDTG